MNHRKSKKKKRNRGGKSNKKNSGPTREKKDGAHGLSRGETDVNPSSLVAHDLGGLRVKIDEIPSSSVPTVSGEKKDLDPSSAHISEDLRGEIDQLSTSVPTVSASGAKESNVIADEILKGNDEDETPWAWADALPAIPFNAMITDPTYYWGTIISLREKFHSPKESDDIEQMLITTDNLNKFFKIAISTTETTAYLILNAAEAYIVTYKAGKVWYAFTLRKPPENGPTPKHKCPTIAGWKSVPFTESYPSMTIFADVEQKDLPFGPRFIEKAVNNLSNEDPSVVAKSVFQLTCAFPESIRFNPVLIRIASSYLGSCTFGSFNTFLVHVWSLLSRFFHFRKERHYETKFVSFDVEGTISLIEKVVGLLKRNTRRQSVVGFANEFLKKAEDSECDLYKVLKQKWVLDPKLHEILQKKGVLGPELELALVACLEQALQQSLE